MSQAIALVKGTTKVYIQANKVDEIIMNKLSKIPIPIVKSGQNTTTTNTLFVDLKRIEHSFTITGFLSVEEGSGNENYTSAKQLKDCFISGVLYRSGDIQMYYRGDLTKISSVTTASGVYADSNINSDATYKNATNDLAVATNHIKVSCERATFTDGAIRSEVISGANASSPIKYDVTLLLVRGTVK